MNDEAGDAPASTPRLTGLRNGAAGGSTVA